MADDVGPSFFSVERDAPSLLSQLADRFILRKETTPRWMQEFASAAFRLLDRWIGGTFRKQPREIKATQEKKCNARVSLPSYAMQSNNIDDSRKGFKTKG